MEGLVNLLDYPVYSTTFCVFPFCAIHYIVETGKVGSSSGPQ